MPKIENRREIHIGNGVTFRASSNRTRIGAGFHGSVSIGNNTFINGGTNIYSESMITIAEGCMIGENVTIFDTNFHCLPGENSVKIKPVLIGQHVWLANNSMILPGVHIGAFSVVGANSVITKSQPEKSLIAGNPGELKRTFD